MPVLILGESGTGKELVARALHALSPRRAQRFEAVNCGALTRELLLSELFGHERGAFTGAVERRPGLLRDVDGGTVLLDEVGELVPEAQSMLLRFLATGEVRPVGATRVVHPDVRIVGATHRDLRAAETAGRSATTSTTGSARVVLEVPPLRERREDIPLLVEHLRRQANARYGLTIDGIAASAMARLVAYPWPGNVRELEAVVEEAMIVKGQGGLDRGTSRSIPCDKRLTLACGPSSRGPPPSGRPRSVSGPRSRSRPRAEAWRAASSSQSPASRASWPGGPWLTWRGWVTCGESGVGGGRGTWWVDLSAMPGFWIAPPFRISSTGTSGSSQSVGEGWPWSTRLL